MAFEAGARDFGLKDNLTRLMPAIRRTLKDPALLAAEERLHLMAAVFDATWEGVAITDLTGHVLAPAPSPARCGHRGPPRRR